MFTMFLMFLVFLMLPVIPIPTLFESGSPTLAESEEVKEMDEIPVFRIHTERIKKAKFEGIADYLGLRGKPVVTEDALFLQDRQRALAYAMPGSRFAGLLFFTEKFVKIDVHDDFLLFLPPA